MSKAKKYKVSDWLTDGHPMPYSVVSSNGKVVARTKGLEFADKVARGLNLLELERVKKEDFRV